MPRQSIFGLTWLPARRATSQVQFDNVRSQLTWALASVTGTRFQPRRNRMAPPTGTCLISLKAREQFRSAQRGNARLVRRCNLTRMAAVLGTAEINFVSKKLIQPERHGQADHWLGQQDSSQRP